jgi:glycosyltransferase involved in cell wall biosynthesis
MLRQLKELIRPYYLKCVYFRLKKEHRPACFDLCWDFPTSSLEEFIATSTSEAGNRHDVVFLPMADWHMYTQRSQHLAGTFAEMGYTVFYLSPHLGREFPETYLNSPRSLISSLGPRLHEMHVHLWREPVYHHRSLRPDESALVADRVERLLRRDPARQVTLIVSFPVWWKVAAQLRERLGCKIIYDCHDLLTGFTDVGPDLLESENWLFAHSDAVLFSSKYLMRLCLDEHPVTQEKAVLVRNAVDWRDFCAEGSSARSNGSTRRKVIGYVGGLNWWFDTEAVERAALQHPEWDFVLIGPVASDKLDVLRGIPNIEFRGTVPYDQLLEQLANFDVGVIPFIKTPLTLATNPVKIYEYFACGLPVVSSSLPEVEQFAGLVYMAEDPDDFVKQVERALQEDGSLRQERMKVARRESWAARCQQIETHMKSLHLSHGPAYRI